MDELTRLFVAAREGDETALATAIRRAQPEVWRFCAHLLSRSEADDLTQEVFLRAFRALPAFRGEASARTWLLAIARRAAADAIRQATRRRRLRDRLVSRTEADDGVAAPETGLVGLDELVGRLPTDRREAFVLTQVLGCSYHEAAEICGVPIGTIRSRVARARTDLVEELRAAEAG